MQYRRRGWTAFSGSMAGLLLISTGPADATFHITDFIEIFSNEDGTIQYIEMQMQSDFQEQFQGEALTTNANEFTFPNDLPSTDTQFRSILIATQGFADLPGAPAPDYIIPSNFFNTGGDTITLVQGQFGDFLFGPGDLPVDGVSALRKDLSTVTNSPTNFVGDTASIDVSPLDPDNIFVDFDQAQNGAGTQASPFNNLADAAAAANPNALVNIAPGTSSEVFADAQAISKALTLRNSNSGSGSVVVGLSAARSSERATSGFIAR